jgi:hypothetical protein
MQARVIAHHFPVNFHRTPLQAPTQRAKGIVALVNFVWACARRTVEMKRIQKQVVRVNACLVILKLMVSSALKFDILFTIYQLLLKSI